MPTITANGTSIYYEDVGSGFPIVFLHGWPGDHAMWMLQVPVFSEFYRVITPDIRGHGRSAKPSQGYDMVTLANDLDQLLEALDIDKAFVVSGSLGGAICQKFAIEHTEKLAGAAWANSPTYPADVHLMASDDGSMKPFAEVYLKTLRSGGYQQFWERTWKPTLLSDPPYLFTKEFVSSEFGKYIVHYLFEERYARMNKDATGLIAVIESARKEVDMTPELAKLRVPAAIIAREGGESQHSLLPGVDYVEIKNSGFFCYLEKPEEFNNFVMQFLRKHEPR